MGLGQLSLDQLLPAFELAQKSRVTALVSGNPRFVTNEEPGQVLAHLYSTPDDPRFREVEEAVAFTLRFPSGVIGQFATGYGAHRSSRFRVMSERGWADLNPAFQYQGNRLVVGRRIGQQEGIEERNVIDAFSESLLTGRPFKAPGELGLRDHQIMAAIYEAARSGRAVSLNP